MTPAVVHGVSLKADNWPLDVETEAVAVDIQRVVVVTAALVAGAGCREAGPVDTIVEQRVVVVAAAIAAGAGNREAEQVVTIVVQHVVVVTLAVTVVGWGAAVVTIVDDLDTAGVVETGLGVNLKQPKGLIMFPS